jgi:hypothetical protein
MKEVEESNVRQVIFFPNWFTSLPSHSPGEREDKHGKYFVLPVDELTNKGHNLPQ